MASAEAQLLGMSSYSQIFPAAVTPAGIIRRLRGFVELVTGPETPELAAIRREAERMAAAEELARLEALRAEELPRLAAAEEKARKNLEGLKPAYLRAVAALSDAEAAHVCRAHDFAYGRQTLERRIERAAEPVIDEFMQDMNQLHQQTLAIEIESDERNPFYDRTGSKMVFESWSNRPSIEARAVAVLAARNEAEAMKTDPDQSTICERLAALVEALPDANVKLKVAG